MRRATDAANAALASERAASREKEEALVAEQLLERQALTAEYAHAQQLLQEQLAAAQEALAELQGRYDVRESRPEDLQMIERLKMMVKEKDELVRRTYEEMKYFKLELQNREENFNKNFGAGGFGGGGPRVGVMVPNSKGGAGAGPNGGMKNAIGGVMAANAIGGGGIGNGLGGGIGGPIGVGGGSPAPSNDKVPSAGRRRGQQRGPPETNAVDPTAVQLQQIPTQPAAGGVPAGSTDPKRPSRERRPLVAQ